MRRLLLGLLVALVGCTPAQMRAFSSWHEADPTGAEEWLASEEGQATLDDIVTVSRSSIKWDVIAFCETGGNWQMRKTNGSGTFGGGLAIEVSPYDGWSTFGGDEFAAQPWLASREEQIVVAERIAARVGLSKAWQCA